jgi:putative heme iron utilization protein
MEQLEIKPRSHGSDLNAELLKAVSSSGLTPEVFSQMADRDEKLVEKLSAAFAEAMGQALKSIAPKPTK